MSEQYVTGEKEGNIFYMTFSRPEKRNAISFGMLEEIAKILGQSRAMEILMTTNRYPAQQALEWGLVNYLYPTKEELFDRLPGKRLTESVIQL